MQSNNILTTLSKTGELSFSSWMVTLMVHTSSRCGFPLSVALTVKYTCFSRVGSSRSNICEENENKIFYTHRWHRTFLVIYIILTYRVVITPVCESMENFERSPGALTNVYVIVPPLSGGSLSNALTYAEKTFKIIIILPTIYTGYGKNTSRKSLVQCNTLVNSCVYNGFSFRLDWLRGLWERQPIKIKRSREAAIRLKNHTTNARKCFME